MFSQKSEQKSAQEQMITNPDMMSNMMKQNLSGIVPQVLHISSFLESRPVMKRSLRVTVCPFSAGFSYAPALRAELPLEFCARRLSTTWVLARRLQWARL